MYKGVAGVAGPPGPASELVAVETVALLRADNPGIVVDAVRVLNELQRQGTFFWDEQPATDDGGTRFNAGGLGSSEPGWQRIFTGPVDVRWFGALGDNVTDDTASIQLAVNSVAPTNGGQVYLPPGIYKVTSTIALKTGVLLTGAGCYYVGPGGGGQGGTVLRWAGGNSGIIVSMIANPDDIRHAGIANLVITGNFGTTNANTVIGLKIAGSGGLGGRAVNECTFSNIVIAEVNKCVQWGDPAEPLAQADSITFDQCSFFYFHTYGMHIQSGNASDASNLKTCLFFSYPPDNPNAIGVYFEVAGFLTIDSCDAAGPDVFIKAAAGTPLTIINCESEGCNWFLDVTSANDTTTINLIGNYINNSIRVNAIARIAAMGNTIYGMNRAGSPTPHILGSGARWQGFANRYLPPFFSIDTSGGGTFTDESLPNAGGRYDQEYHTQGSILRWPGPMFGVAPDSAGDVNFAAGELCIKTGWRGNPWAAVSVQLLGAIIVPTIDNNHAYQATSIGSPPHETGATEPVWNTGSGSTTTDGDITWTEIGPSSHNALFAPPDQFRGDGIPGGYIRKGTIVWNQANYAADKALGWVAIQDTYGATAAHWRSFGTTWGSNDGTTIAHGNTPIIGSVLELNPLLFGAVTVVMSDADHTLLASEYVQTKIGLTGTLTATRTVKWPDLTSLGGGRVAIFLVNNGSAQNLILDTTTGGTTVTLAPNESTWIQVVGANVTRIDSLAATGVQIGGDLSGSPSAPNVAKVNGVTPTTSATANAVAVRDGSGNINFLGVYCSLVYGLASPFSFYDSSGQPLISLYNPGHYVSFFQQTLSNGDNVIAVANRNSAPTVSPTGGGIWYEEAGAQIHYGSSGTVTTVAPA